MIMSYNHGAEIKFNVSKIDHLISNTVRVVHYEVIVQFQVSSKLWITTSL